MSLALSTQYNHCVLNTKETLINIPKKHLGEIANNTTITSHAIYLCQFLPHSNEWMYKENLIINIMT